MALAGGPAQVVVKRIRVTARQVARAWMPFVLLTGTVLVWGLPAVKSRMPDRDWKWEIPGLHQQIVKGQAIPGHAEPTAKDREDARADLVPISSTGTSVFAPSLSEKLTPPAWVVVIPPRWLSQAK